MPKRENLHSQLLGLVQQYLRERGYEKTLSRLVKECGIEFDEAEDHGSLFQMYRAHMSSKHVDVRSSFQYSSNLDESFLQQTTTTSSDEKKKQEVS